MKSLNIPLLLGACTIVLPLTTSAADVEAGKKIANTVCVACHGANGMAAIPMYPHLAGQNEQYLVSALQAYKTKQRTGAQATLMQGQAAALSDADIANVAAYYANLKKPAGSTAPSAGGAATGGATTGGAATGGAATGGAATGAGTGTGTPGAGQTR